MSKRLLSNDYKEFITETTKLSYKDVYYHVLNFCESNIEKNPNIIQNLFNHTFSQNINKNALREWLNIGSDLGKNHPELWLSIFDNANQVASQNADNPTLLKTSSYFILIISLSHINASIESAKEQREFELGLPIETIIKLYNITPKIDFNNLDFEFLHDRREEIKKLTINLINSNLPPTQTYKESHINTFNNVPIQKVREIFGGLKTKKSLKNNKPFLTEEQFEQFINQAFLGIESIGKINITYNSGSDNIRLKHLFANFFEYSKKHHYNPISKKLRKEHFVNLFLNNFNSHFNHDLFGEHWKKEPLKEKVIWKYEELKEY